MRQLPAILAVGMAALLSACAPAPRAVPAVVAAPPVDLTPGFAEREPDTCKAAGLQGLVGQPSGNLRTVRLPGPVRMVAPGQVVDQEEYRSDRINVQLDGEGLIQGLSCG